MTYSNIALPVQKLAAILPHQITCLHTYRKACGKIAVTENLWQYCRNVKPAAILP
jgi:hypothetical protein